VRNIDFTRAKIERRDQREKAVDNSASVSSQCPFLKKRICKNRGSSHRADRGREGELPVGATNFLSGAKKTLPKHLKERKKVRRPTSAHGPIWDDEGRTSNESAGGGQG